MQIFIKTLTGTVISIECESQDTVLNIKKKIKEKSGIDIEEQQLIFCGRLMLNNQTVESFQLHKEGFCHLLIKLPEVNQDLLNNFEKDDIKLYWAVNYLSETDNKFPSETMQVSVSDDLEIAFASYEKRHGMQAPNQSTYLSLMAVKKSVIDKCHSEDAPPKYQPKNGKMLTYTSYNADIPVANLCIAVLVGDKLSLIENPSANIHYSEKYRDKLHQLQVFTYQTNTKNNEKKENLPQALFNAADDMINQEINFNIDDDMSNQELKEVKDQLEAFIGKIKEIENFPIDIGNNCSNILSNVLLRMLNLCRNMVTKDVSDQTFINHIIELIQKRIETINPPLAPAALPPVENINILPQNKKLLVLDVEGTIITGYDYEKENEDKTIPAIIDKNLAVVLEKFSKAGYKIVIATGTDGDNLEYYKKEFKKAGISQFISEYSPTNHERKDSKSDKLSKYSVEFSIPKEDIYFFDDGKGNVDEAKSCGFKYSFQVTNGNPLTKQLLELSQEIKMGISESRAHQKQENNSYEKWLVAVYALFKVIENETHKFSYLDKDAAFSYLATVLRAIRKNEYSELSKDPENIGAIPQNIFSVINSHIHQYNFILDKIFISQNTTEQASEISKIEQQLHRKSLEFFDFLGCSSKEIKTSEIMGKPGIGIYPSSSSSVNTMRNPKQHPDNNEKCLVM